METTHPIVKGKINDIMNFVNSLPLNSKDARLKMAKKLLDETFTTDPAKAYKEEKEEEKKDNGVIIDEEKKDSGIVADDGIVEVGGYYSKGHYLPGAVLERQETNVGIE
jgi:hypothetical protein